MNNQPHNQSDGLGCAVKSTAITGVVLLVFALWLQLLTQALGSPAHAQSIAAESTTAVVNVVSQPSQVVPTATIPPTLQPVTSATPAEVASMNTNTTASQGYDPSLISAGQTTYSTLCIACHGADAHGLPNLGKDLVNSEFVHSTSDEDLLTFIKTGRPMWDPANTTGIDMPPKGGNPALTDAEILGIIAYLRSLSGAVTTVAQSASQPAPTNVPEVVVPITTSVVTSPVSVPSVTSVPSTASESNAGASSASQGYDPALISVGQTTYSSLCIACHGADAHGLPNLGKDLVNSEFVHSLNDEELLTFIKTGRPMWDPANTSGIDMPPKGGNPALTDDQILSVVAYLRSLENGSQ